MISKKVLGPALTGTGAVGASGTLAWTLGLLDEEILDDVVEEKRDASNPGPEQQKNSPSNPEKQPKVTAQDRQTKTDGAKSIQRGVGARRVGQSTWKAYFDAGSGVSEYDRKAVNSSSTLKVEWKEVMKTLLVNETGDSWNCELKAIIIDGSSSKPVSSEIEKQRSKLEEALKNDDNKNQFVANCSRTRSTEEAGNGGAKSAIELETKNITWDTFKFKDEEGYFERLWTEDFSGVDRVKKEDEWILESKNTKKINVEVGTKVKVEISFGDKNWSCYFSGNYAGNLGKKTFKENSGLKDILDLHETSTKKEKKKYLIRNCRKNNWEIKGLKIKVEGANWVFDDDSLKKISEGMYENPSDVKP